MNFEIHVGFGLKTKFHLTEEMLVPGFAQLSFDVGVESTEFAHGIGKHIDLFLDAHMVHATNLDNSIEYCFFEWGSIEKLSSIQLGMMSLFVGRYHVQ